MRSKHNQNRSKADKRSLALGVSEAALSALALAALQPGAAAAQESARAAETSEIVVTARRREERLQDVPVAVSAFSAEALRARSADTIAEASEAAPNVTFDPVAANSGTANATTIFIRGIGQDDFLPTADPGVGIYIDGVYLGRTVGGLLGLKDIERVEVLRGPQGTLFGRNTVGGAINVTTQRPGFDPGGFIEAVAGTDALYEVSARVEGPLAGDQLAGSLFVDRRVRDGYGRSTTAPEIDFGNEDKFAARGQLLLRASDTLEFLASADYYKQDQNGLPSALVEADFTSPNTLLAAYNNFAPALGLPVSTPADLVDKNNPYLSNKTGPSKDDSESWGVNLTAKWDAFDWGGFKSITSYRTISMQFDEDSDGGQAQIATTFISYDQNQFSQEFQFFGEAGKWDWVSGLFYFTESADNPQTALIIPGLFDLLVAGGAPPTAVINNDNELLFVNNIDVDNYAAYAHVTYDLTEKLNFALGLRYTYEEKSLFKETLRLSATEFFGTPIGTPLGTVVSDTWSQVTPYIGAKYSFTDDLMAYASFSQGFKSGTFNGRATLAESLFQTVDPETVDSFEIGIKSSWLEDRLTFNAAAFQNTYQDLQFSAVLPSSQGVTAFVINAGEAEITGLELELAADFRNGLQFGGALGLQDAEITKQSAADAAATGVREGNRLRKTPETTYNVYLQYTLPFSDWELRARADWNWRSEIFHDAQNNASTKEDAKGQLNARIALADAAGDWELAAYGKNITDEVIYATLFRTSGAGTIGYPLRGQEFGVSLRRNF